MIKSYGNNQPYGNFKMKITNSIFSPSIHFVHLKFQISYIFHMKYG